MQIKPIVDSARCELVSYEAIGQLSLPALGLLVYLLRFGETHEGAIGDLAARKGLGLSRAKVEAAAKELRLQGFMVVDRSRGADGKIRGLVEVHGRPNPEWAAAEQAWSANMSKKMSGPRKPVW